MLTPRDSDDFPAESQKWRDDASTEPLLLRSEPAIPRVHDVGRVTFETLIPRDHYDETDSFIPSSRPPRPWFAVSIALLFGTVAGFAGGYIVAGRLATSPVTATEVTDLAEEPTRPRRPILSESRPSVASDAPPNSDSAAVVPSRPAPAPPTPTLGERRTQRESRPSSGLGSLEIASRPSGAQVSLDGRIVGRTPLSIPGVGRGSHVVGVELAGYNRWAASVLVTPDNPTRVGASLEPSVPREGN